MKRALGKMLVGNILTTAAIWYHDEPAFYCSSTDRRFSFRAVDERTNRLAQAVLGLAFCKGEVIAFLCTNRAEIVEIYFALARTGIVGLPLNYRLADPEILELMRAMGAKGLIFEAKFSSIAKPQLNSNTSYKSAAIRPIWRSATRSCCQRLWPAPPISKLRRAILFIST
jgi:acyl-CoA synthetase (AMP-forming)/AMP-acid ligase II